MRFELQLAAIAKRTTFFVTVMILLFSEAHSGLIRDRELDGKHPAHSPGLRPRGLQTVRAGAVVKHWLRRGAYAGACTVTPHWQRFKSHPPPSHGASEDRDWEARSQRSTHSIRNLKPGIFRSRKGEVGHQKEGGMGVSCAASWASESEHIQVRSHVSSNKTPLVNSTAQQFDQNPSV
jgi:hypothetical protein